jgi:hypothetical protein
MTKQAATSKAPKTDKAAKTDKAPKAAKTTKEASSDATEVKPQTTKEPAVKPSPTPAPQPKKAAPKKEAPKLLPEAERRDLRTKNMAEYNVIRKAVREGAKGAEIEKLRARLKVLARVYREQNLKEFSSRK